MINKNIGIIGYGSWAKRIIPTLANYFNIKFVTNSKIDFKIIDLKGINWIFVLTSNDTHDEIVKYFLKKKKNVFCEKPLTESLYKTIQLYKLAKKNKCKLYVNDVEIYKNKKIELIDKNLILRFKKSKKSKVSLLFRLAYHDFYLFENFINLKNLKKIKIYENNVSLKINFLEKNISYNFNYKINSDNEIHLINNVNFLNFKKKPLNTMFYKIQKGRADFKGNKKRTLFSSELIFKLNKKYK